MNNLINRTKFSTLALVLLLTITTLMVVIPAQAQDLTDGTTTLPTFLQLSAAPSPVGVHQTLNVNTFLTKPPLTGGMGGSGVMYEGIIVEVTKPNGNVDEYGPYTTDSTGGAWFSIDPDMVGSWTLQAHYPEQRVEYMASSFMGPSVFYNFTYAASDSDIVTVDVQEEDAQWNYRIPSLPEEYWTRPIYSTNWEWGEKLGGSWFGLAAPAFAVTGRYDANGNFNPYSLAPNSGHIMWSKATHNGGQPGGPIYSDQSGNFKTTTIINNYFDPIVVNGILYYAEHAGPSNNVVGWNAVDIRTGELVWTRETTENLRLGQSFRTKSIQEYGSWSVLYGAVGGGFFSSVTELNIYDAFSGEYLASIENPQSTSFLMDDTYGQEGTLLAWYTEGGNLTMWKSNNLYGGDDLVLSVSGTYNWSDGVEWSVPMPNELDGESLSLSVGATTPEVILLRQTPSPGQFISLSLGWQVTAGMDARTGELLWGPVNQTIPMFEDISIIAAGEGAYVLHNKDTNEAYGYSLENGNRLWGPVKLPGNAWSTITRSGDIAYGKVFIWDYGGYCSAINLQTGNIEWTWTRGDAGLDTPYGIYELWYNDAIADGKIILSEGKMYDPPLHPAKTVAINVTTGETIWTLTGWTGRNCPIVADGYVILWNSQDAKIYSIGKGPTTTTVTAGPKVTKLGSSVLIEGSVMDISPGSKQSGVVERFPNGIPVADDAYMDDWMSYVYMQQVCPENFMGVTVHITALDPNNNYQDYGITVTDMNGNFALPFMPEVEGTYWITATFEGSESYWRSQATTYMTVDPAAEPYPDVPTQEEIADDAARRTIAMLPSYPEMPEYQEAPAYQTIDLVLIVLVVIAIIIGIYGVIKKK
ncbi:MAG: PQQ-binding-like beta-propeller repeat protein [Candidatus Bathyarchaeota archaeon]